MAEDAKPARLSPHECRQQASRCRRMAESAGPEQRAMLEQMAEIWERMARDVDQGC